MSESKLYFFYTIGCGWCTRAMPYIDELNEDGHDILKLDLDEPVNKKIEDELKSKYGIKCGTPLFINASTGHYICGYREKDILLKWIKGEPVPPPPKPKSPMPRIPFHGRPKKEINEWVKKYEVWVDENSHLSDLKTVEELLAMPRPKSIAPQPPTLNATPEQVNEWKKNYKSWMKENSHLPNLVSPEQILQRLQFQRRSVQTQQTVKDINLETRINTLEKKIDKLMMHLGVK